MQSLACTLYFSTVINYANPTLLLRIRKQNEFKKRSLFCFSRFFFSSDEQQTRGRSDNNNNSPYQPKQQQQYQDYPQQVSVKEKDRDRLQIIARNNSEKYQPKIFGFSVRFLVIALLFDCVAKKFRWCGWL